MLRPDAESIISAIQAPQEKVVFVKSFPYYSNIRRVYNIELHIVRERDKLATHCKK